jgi:UDP-N-acetylmuramoyl-L-alanyl-D-glutamate--2,6-diaminopimelate ligase
VTGASLDSRAVRPGDLYAALPGARAHGAAFSAQAVDGGAVAVLTDPAGRPEAERAGRPVLVVDDPRGVLGEVCAAVYGRPAERMLMLGVTGTNGKTTTSFILHRMLQAAKRKTMLLGTVEYRIGDEILPSPHTTPESLELNQLFARALSAGCTEVVMEVSSHALDQGRVYGIPFDVALFTNLTRDHLDYHQTMENYFAAKTILFKGSGVEPPRAAVINVEDSYGLELVKLCKKQEELITYGVDKGDFHARDIKIEHNGVQFTLVTPQGELPIYTPLLGRVNLYNLIAASAAAYARDIAFTAMAEAADQIAQIAGRFERVDAGQPFTVIVDYAHTPDALLNLTALARDFVHQRGGPGRVITVFGCGGDRDRSKRPMMGEAAGNGSDFVILTSDNPRSENPVDIMNDAMPGIQRSGARYTLEPSRKKAIELAINEANAGDIVLIAGKGHEKIQVTREGTLPFDDVQVARAALEHAGYGSSTTAHPATV